MKQIMKKFSIFLILFILLVTTISIVSASENITDSTNLENIDNQHSDEIKLDDGLNDESDEVLNANNVEEELLGSISASDRTFDINLDKPTFPSIDVKVTDTFGDPITSGTVNFEVNGKKYTANLQGVYTKSPGHAILSGNTVFKDVGQYTIKATYKSMSKTFKYTINGKTSVSINDISVNNGQYITINPTITPKFNSNFKAGDLKIRINGYTYVLNSNNPSLRLKLSTGTYSCTAEYGTNPYYVKSSDTFKIVVAEEPLIVAQDYYIVNLGKKLDLKIYVVDSNGNPISGGKIYLNDYSAPVTNGYAQFTINPQNVAYEEYSVQYSPNSKHYKSVSITNAFPIVAVSNTKLSISPLNTMAGTKISNVKFTITDNLNRKISPSGYFLINGKKYNSLKDFKTPKKPGTFKYTVEFVPDLILYGVSKTTFKIVNKVKTKIKVKSVSGLENKKVKLTAIVKDNYGKKVKKGTVIFKFKGKKYKAKVKNGKAKKTIRIPKNNNRGIFYKYGEGTVTKVYDDVTYKGKVQFLANKHYLSSSSKFKVTSIKKSKTEGYAPIHIYEGDGEVSHKKTKKTKKTTKNQKQTNKKKSYGYYPKYHKKIPNLNTDLFKKKPQFNTNMNLNNIVITV